MEFDGQGIGLEIKHTMPIHKTKLKLTLFAFMVGCFFLSAQVKKWSLRDCIAHAIENNLTIKQSVLDVKEGQIAKSDAFGALLPNVETVIEGSERAGLNFDPTTNRVVTSRLLTGTGNLAASVTLFDGLRNYGRVARARLEVISQQYRLENLKDDLTLNITNTFLQVLSNQESLKVLKAQYIVSEQDVMRTKELVSSGMVPKGDLLDIEANLATRRQQMIEGENLVLISKLNLAQLLQIEDTSTFNIQDDYQKIPSLDTGSTSAEEIFHKALIHRSDVKVSQVGVKIAEKDLVIARGARYPSLTGFFEYDTRYSALMSDSNTDLRVGFFDQLYLNDGIQVRADLDIPIFSRFAIHNGIKRAKIGVALANNAFKRTLLELEADIYRAHVDASNFLKAYEAALKTAKSRRLAHDYSIERFKAGLMNVFNFTQSKARVDSAEAELIRAKYEYIFRLEILKFYNGHPIGQS